MRFGGFNQNANICRSRMVYHKATGKKVPIRFGYGVSNATLFPFLTMTGLVSIWIPVKTVRGERMFVSFN